MGKLDGKVALITGGSSGIGLATAHEFVKEGAFVFITGRREAELAAAAAEIGRNATGLQISEEFYQSIFDVNVKGVRFTVQKALPLIPNGGSIILNASIVGSKGLPANSIYSATKAAIRSFARTWTTDLKDRHIRVNAVSPGSTDTAGLRDLL